MNYIKLFESFDEILNFKNGQLYKLLGNKYDQFIRLKEIETATTSDIIKIRKIFNDESLYVTSNNGIYYHEMLRTNKSKLLPQRIYKYEDDWWIVILSRNSIATGMLLPIILCDGIEGIKSLVDNMVEIREYPYLVIE
jgi:hypothetical protein